MPKYMRLRVFWGFWAVVFVLLTVSLIFFIPGAQTLGYVLGLVVVAFFAIESVAMFWHWASKGHVSFLRCQVCPPPPSTTSLL